MLVDGETAEFKFQKANYSVFWYKMLNDNFINFSKVHSWFHSRYREVKLIYYLQWTSQYIIMASLPEPWEEYSEIHITKNKITGIEQD
jgi:hypothetical protein